MKINETQIVITILVLVVGYFLVNRFFMKPKPKEVPKTQDVIADLEGMKFDALNSARIELYRSATDSGHTIAGTILEQAIDIIVAVLEKPDITKIGNIIIQSKEDADNVAEMIEEVGKDIVTNIKNFKGDTLPGKKLVQQLVPTVKASLRDELQKTDIWYPIFLRFMENHGDKKPFNNMSKKQKENLKNASSEDIEQMRMAIENQFDLR
jgi:Ribonuclease G/E